MFQSVWRTTAAGSENARKEVFSHRLPAHLHGVRDPDGVPVRARV